jgi:quercetin dioxygenase-like cupin family protein
VTDGTGLVAHRGDGVREIRPGDVVYIEPNEEHWHGATPDRFMAHVAIQEADERGQVVTWLDHVMDEEYTTT